MQAIGYALTLAVPFAFGAFCLYQGYSPYWLVWPVLSSAVMLNGAYK